MSVLRYYAKFPRRLFTQKHSWYDFLLGSTRIERREAELKEWEQDKIFQQLKNDLVRFQFVQMTYSKLPYSRIYCEKKYLQITQFCFQNKYSQFLIIVSTKKIHRRYMDPKLMLCSFKFW